MANGKVQLQSTGKKMKNESLAGLELEVTKNDNGQKVMVFGRRGTEGQVRDLVFDDAKMEVSYGSQQVKVPFSIYLKDFEMERYPGTNNPSSYASEVEVNDLNNNVKMPEY